MWNSAKARLRFVGRQHTSREFSPVVEGVEKRLLLSASSRPYTPLVDHYFLRVGPPASFLGTPPKTLSLLNGIGGLVGGNAFKTPSIRD